jgi:hypothetical protein
MPHVQGGFRERLVVRAGQARPLPARLAPERAVLAEPSRWASTPAFELAGDRRRASKVLLELASRSRR